MLLWPRHFSHVNLVKRHCMSDVVCILGCTATGKSRLAIDLALSLHKNPLPSTKQAEIINADALQVYKALPLLTAKVSSNEMQNVRHHLISFLDPLERQEYHVNQFAADASQIISSLAAESTLPVIVGGTSYYVQHLIAPPTPVETETKTLEQLFARLGNNDDLARLAKLLPTLPMISSPSTLPAAFPIDQLPQSFRRPEALARALWDLLQVANADTAQRWHWRDVRKVRRQLELLVPDLQTDTQRHEPTTREKMRCLVFWLHTDKEALESRLDKRVDQMVEDGLLDEVKSLLQPDKTGEVEYTQGVRQAIGFRPFAEYSSKVDKTSKDLEIAIETTKVNTRQYAKKQLAWFRHKLLPAIAVADHIHVYALDTSSAESDWVSVVQKADQVMRAFLARDSMPEPSSIFFGAHEILQLPHKQIRLPKVICESCTINAAAPVMIDDGPGLAVHQASKRHRAMVRKRITDA